MSNGDDKKINSKGKKLHWITGNITPVTRAKIRLTDPVCKEGKIIFEKVLEYPPLDGR